MIRTAWNLGARPDLEDLRLRAWAHMLGFRGHFSTKTRRYSTTLGALRDARADWRRAQAAANDSNRTRSAVAIVDQAEDTTLRPRPLGLRRNRPHPRRTMARRNPQPAPGTEGEPTHG